MKYEDLLAVPFKVGGRDFGGMDCYGFLIECQKRTGRELKDLAATPEGDLSAYLSSLNVEEIPEYKNDCCAQFLLDGKLHVGHMLNRREILHMTFSGVRITPIKAMKNARYFEVIND